MMERGGSDHGPWRRLGVAAVVVLALVALVAGQAWAQGGIVLDGVGDDWDPSWQVATDPLDVFITGTGNHPHDAPTYARSGYDIVGLWAHYNGETDRWLFRLDVDGRAGDSDSQTGTPGNLGVGTHAVDGGPLGGDSTGIGPPEAYTLVLTRYCGIYGMASISILGGNSAILPGVRWPTTGGAGRAAYGTTVPGVVEWRFDRDQILPDGPMCQGFGLSATARDTSDLVSDDQVAQVLLGMVETALGCPEPLPIDWGEVTIPLRYSIPDTAALGLTDVTLTAPIPAGTAFVRASHGGTSSGGVVTWHLGNLAPGDTGQVTFTVQVDEGAESLPVSSLIAAAEGVRAEAEGECLLVPGQIEPEPEPEPEFVPEAGTLGLLLTGLSGLAGYGALRKRAR